MSDDYDPLRELTLYNALKNLVDQLTRFEIADLALNVAIDEAILAIMNATPREPITPEEEAKLVADGMKIVKQVIAAFDAAQALGDG